MPPLNIGILYLGRKRMEFSQEQDWPFFNVTKGQHNITPLFEPLISCVYKQQTLELFYDQQPFPDFDVIICRTATYEEPSLHTVTMDLLKDVGYRLINAFPTVGLSKNKMAQQEILSKAHVPMPDWAMIRHPDQTQAAIDKIGFPFVAKVPIGGRGKGIFYVENKKTLQPILDYLNIRDHNPIILQKYIQESSGRDLRVFVIGHEVVACMERISQTEDIRANAALGAKVKAFLPTKEIISIALQATEAMELEIAGVDILLSHQGPLVIEVNACPGFHELQTITDINIAKAIIAYAEKKVINT